MYDFCHHQRHQQQQQQKQRHRHQHRHQHHRHHHDHQQHRRRRRHYHTRRPRRHIVVCIILVVVRVCQPLFFLPWLWYPQCQYCKQPTSSGAYLAAIRHCIMHNFIAWIYLRFKGWRQTSARWCNMNESLSEHKQPNVTYTGYCINLVLRYIYGQCR